MLNIACDAVSSVNCQISGTNRNFLSGLDFTRKINGSLRSTEISWKKNTFNVSNQ